MRFPPFTKMGRAWAPHHLRYVLPSVEPLGLKEKVILPGHSLPFEFITDAFQY